MNPMPSMSTSYSPFYLNFIYPLVTPLGLMRDRNESRIEAIENFIKRMEDVFKRAKSQMSKAQEMIIIGVNKTEEIWNLQ